MDKQIIVAIDGYSSCGKSTMAKALARSIGYVYIDTGAMYRGIALASERAGLFKEGGEVDTLGLEKLLGETTLAFALNAEGLPELLLNGESVEKLIRTMEMGTLASRIASLPMVRTFVTSQLQRMGREGGIVMDGRDIGTVVFPQAEVKIFVTASPEVRAQRRLLELEAKGEKHHTLASIQQGLEERDYQDSHREIAPLRQAEDAFLLDNSLLTPEQQLLIVRERVQSTLERLRASGR